MRSTKCQTRRHIRRSIRSIRFRHGAIASKTKNSDTLGRHRQTPTAPRPSANRAPYSPHRHKSASSIAIRRDTAPTSQTTTTSLRFRPLSHLSTTPIRSSQDLSRRKPISTLQPSPAFVRRGYGATISPPTRYAHITTQTTPLGSATRPNTRQIRHKTTSIFRGVAMHPCAALSKYRRATPAITARRRPKRGSR